LAFNLRERGGEKKEEGGGRRRSLTIYIITFTSAKSFQIFKDFTVTCWIYWIFYWIEYVSQFTKMSFFDLCELAALDADNHKQKDVDVGHDSDKRFSLIYISHLINYRHLFKIIRY
jgi:hypothetical protein